MTARPIRRIKSTRRIKQGRHIPSINKLNFKIEYPVNSRELISTGSAGFSQFDRNMLSVVKSEIERKAMGDIVGMLTELGSTKLKRVKLTEKIIRNTVWVDPIRMSLLLALHSIKDRKNMREKSMEEYLVNLGFRFFKLFINYSLGEKHEVVSVLIRLLFYIMVLLL